MKKYILRSLIAALIMGGLVFASINDYGIGWDEPSYIYKGNSYLYWIQHPSIESIADAWLPDDTHPPFYKLTGALLYDIFTIKLHILSTLQAYRLTTILFVTTISFILCLFASIQWGLLIGIFASLSFILTPRTFFFAHMATLDIPITSLYFAAIISLVVLSRYRHLTIIPYILCGLAIATKAQGAYVYVAFLTYHIFFRKRTITTHFSALVFYYAIPLLIFFAIWPYLWINPIHHFVLYSQTLVSHFTVGSWYFHTFYENAPPSYSLFYFFGTTPVSLLIFFFGGLFYAFKYKNKIIKFFLFCILFPLTISLLPTTLRYDGVRHILLIYPFLSLIAAYGVKFLFSSKHYIARSVGFITLLLWFSSIFTGLVKYHPYEFAYFNELVGGIRTGENLGMEYEHWGTSIKSLIPYINNAQPNDRFCVFPTVQLFDVYKDMNMVYPYIIIYPFNKTWQDKCNKLILFARKGFFNPTVWDIYLHHKPLYGVFLKNILLAGIYDVSLKKE